MSGLNNLKLRNSFRGGSKQQDRMIADKLFTLKRAYLYSYQAAVAELADGRRFRCLINPDKLKKDYDDKIISIPFKDICLDTKQEEETGIKAGDVFRWEGTDSYWIVYLQKLEELAYFHAEIRRCRYELKVNDNNYKVYVRGPVETAIDWNLKKGIVWNDLNYSLVMTITNNEETQDFFKRFTKIKFLDHMWEVQTTDSISTEGIIDVYLKEYYDNSIADAVEKEREENIPVVDEILPDAPAIEGETQLYPYDVAEFAIKNANDGIWTVNNNKVKILSQNSSMVKIEVITGKSGKFTLSYIVNDNIVVSSDISILSL